MIKANISKENQTQDIVVAGAVPEILADIALLIGSIYTQFKNASPNTAYDLRAGIVNMTNDPTSPMWKAVGNQTGIIFRKPDKED